MQEHILEEPVAPATTDEAFDIGTTPTAEQLDHLPGHLPVIIDVKSLDERFAVRDRTLGESESATLFSTVAASHPLEEEHVEDEEEHETEGGDPVSPYATPYSLAALKSGRIKTKKALGGQNDRLKWSRIFRPIFVRNIAENRGWRLREPEWVYQHPSVPKMSANVRWEADVDGRGFFIPIEAHVVGGSERWKWLNSTKEFVIPAPTILRMQHILSVTGCKRGMVLALFGGSEEKIFEIERNEEMISAIEESVASFWSLVDAGEMPEPNYARDGKVIREINHMIDPEKVLDWTRNNEAHDLLAKKSFHANEASRHQEIVDKCTARLWEMIGDAKSAVLGDTILGVSIVKAGEVKFMRPESKRLTPRKASGKHAGSALPTKQKRKKEE